MEKACSFGEGSVRFICAIDVDAPSVKEGYRRLRRIMPRLAPEADWETTDEAYDEDGYPVMKGRLSEIRIEVIEEEDRKAKRLKEKAPEILKACERLVRCPALNGDSLDSEDYEARQAAYEVIKEFLN